MLGIADFPAFVGAVIVFLAIPGPGNLALLTATALGGKKGGLGATFGVIAGDQVWMWSAVAGLTALMQASAFWFVVLQWVGAVYLGYLGIQLIRTQSEPMAMFDMSSGHFFRQAFFVTLFNPKAILFYLAFFPLFIDPLQQPTWLTFSAMALTVALLTLAYGAGLTLLAQRMADRMKRHPAVGRWLQKLAGAVMLGFGLRLVLQK